MWTCTLQSNICQFSSGKWKTPNKETKLPLASQKHLQTLYRLPMEASYKTHTMCKCTTYVLHLCTVEASFFMWGNALLYTLSWGITLHVPHSISLTQKKDTTSSRKNLRVCDVSLIKCRVKLNRIRAHMRQSQAEPRPVSNRAHSWGLYQENKYLFKKIN